MAMKAVAIVMMMVREGCGCGCYEVSAVLMFVFAVDTSLLSQVS